MKPQYTRYYTYIKPFLRNKYVKTYSSVIFSMITITVFSVFAIRPTVSTIISLQKNIADQNQTLEKIQQKADQLTKAKQNYDALPDDTKQNIKSLVPESTSLTELLSSISNLVTLYQASSSGIQVEPADLVDFKDKLGNKPVSKEIQFSINIQGSYEKLSAILVKMSQINRLIYIRSANFNKPVDQPLILSINGNAYYLSN